LGVYVIVSMMHGHTNIKFLISSRSGLWKHLSPCNNIDLLTSQERFEIIHSL